MANKVKGRRLAVGDRYRVPGGDGQVYRVLRVSEASATVKTEAKRHKEIRDRDAASPTFGQVIAAFDASASEVINVSPYSLVEILALVECPTCGGAGEVGSMFERRCPKCKGDGRVEEAA